MNKTDLIDVIAYETDVPKAVAGRVLDAFITTVQKAVGHGQEVALVGFGTFSAKDRAARTGRNPQNGEPITIAAARVPGFKPGKGFKDAVN